MQQTNNLPASLWRATATQFETRKLDQDLSCDVLVIGAGFTGLSAALHLAENRQDVVVVDAVEPGFGASGRNGGQVIPGLKLYPDEVRARLGDELGNAVVKSTNRSANLVFDLINRYGIECHASRQGFIQPAFSPNSCRTIEKRVALLSNLGEPVELIDRQTTAEYLGNNHYHLALLDKRGGALQPLDYARGLARAARSNGASIYSDTAITDIRKSGTNWESRSNNVRIRSRQILICTNAYSEQLPWPKLAKSLIPLFSFQIATKPLNDEIRQTILAQGHVASDTRRLLNYFRLDHQGRLILGGRGGVNDASNHADYQHLTKRIKQLYPQIGEVEIEYFWSGKVALTLDGLPHIHQLAPGIFTGLGFNGRGVAMASLMGQWLANLTTGKADETGILPVTPLRPIAFQHFRKPVISLAYIWKSLQDQIEAKASPALSQRS